MKITRASALIRKILFTFDTNELAKCETIWISGSKIGEKSILGGDLIYHINVNIQRQGKTPLVLEMTRTLAQKLPRVASAEHAFDRVLRCALPAALSDLLLYFSVDVETCRT